MIKNTLALGQDSRDRPLLLSAIMVRDWDSAVPAGLVVPDLPGQLGSKEMGKISNKPGREAAQNVIIWACSVQMLTT